MRFKAILVFSLTTLFAFGQNQIGIELGASNDYYSPTFTSRKAPFGGISYHLALDEKKNIATGMYLFLQGYTFKSCMLDSNNQAINVTYQFSKIAVPLNFEAKLGDKKKLGVQGGIYLTFRLKGTGEHAKQYDGCEMYYATGNITKTLPFIDWGVSVGANYDVLKFQKFTWNVSSLFFSQLHNVSTVRTSAYFPWSAIVKTGIRYNLDSD